MPELSGAARRATITDVAAAAGVSVGTASKALNGRGKISAGTRDRAPAVLGARPELTSVDLCLEEVGRVAAGYLLSAMAGEAPEGVHRVPARLAIRRSSGGGGNGGAPAGPARTGMPARTAAARSAAPRPWPAWGRSNRLEYGRGPRSGESSPAEGSPDPAGQHSRCRAAGRGLDPDRFPGAERAPGSCAADGHCVLLGTWGGTWSMRWPSRCLECKPRGPVVQYFATVESVPSRSTTGLPRVMSQ